MATPRLYRSNDTRMLLGVCGGIAQRWDLDPTLVRLVFVGLCFLGLGGLLLYIIGAVVIPRAPALTEGVSQPMLDRSHDPMRYGGS